MAEMCLPSRRRTAVMWERSLSRHDERIAWPPATNLPRVLTTRVEGRRGAFERWLVVMIGHDALFELDAELTDSMEDVTVLVGMTDENVAGSRATCTMSTYLVTSELSISGTKTAGPSWRARSKYVYGQRTAATSLPATDRTRTTQGAQLFRSRVQQWRCEASAHAGLRHFGRQASGTTPLTRPTPSPRALEIDASLIPRRPLRHA